MLAVVVAAHMLLVVVLLELGGLAVVGRGLLQTQLLELLELLI